jgi:F0F1-type ATP synthase membrane subunit b/b'
VASQGCKTATAKKAATADYEQALADPRGKASVMVKVLRETLADETPTERANVEVQITRLFSDAERRITAAKVKAMANVGELTSERSRRSHLLIDRLLIDRQERRDTIKAAGMAAFAD